MQNFCRNRWVYRMISCIFTSFCRQTDSKMTFWNCSFQTAEWSHQTLEQFRWFRYSFTQEGWKSLTGTVKYDYELCLRLHVSIISFSLLKCINASSCSSLSEPQGALLLRKGKRVLSLLSLKRHPWWQAWPGRRTLAAGPAWLYVLPCSSVASAASSRLLCCTSCWAAPESASDRGENENKCPEREAWCRSLTARKRERKAAAGLSQHYYKCVITQ